MEVCDCLGTVKGSCWPVLKMFWVLPFKNCRLCSFTFRLSVVVNFPRKFEVLFPVLDLIVDLVFEPGERCNTCAVSASVGSEQ